MSTISCSSFLSTTHLSSYEDDKYLLAAHGEFLELYDLDKFHDEEFNAREYEPIRTRVFERDTVKEFVTLHGSDHVLAFTSKVHKHRLTIEVCPIHHEDLLRGGYANQEGAHRLLDEPTRSGRCAMAAISKTNEVLLLTETTLNHLRYRTEFEPDEELDLDYDVIAQYDIQSILPDHFANRPITPYAIAASTDYSAILAIGGCIVLLKMRGDKWICRAMKNTGEVQRVLMIPEAEMAVIGGVQFTKFISTSFHQKGVSKDQIQVIQDKFEPLNTRVLAAGTRDGLIYVYNVAERELATWCIHPANRTIAGPWTFDHSPDSIDICVENMFKSNPKILANSLGVAHRTYPLSALVMTKRIDGRDVELLIISYETGCLKVIDTDDICKPALVTAIRLGTKKMPVECLYPAWEFPLNVDNPLTRLIGLSKGAPVVFQLDSGDTWTNHELIPSRTASYTRMKATTAPGGVTVAVFYNGNSICFCTIGKEIKWKEHAMKSPINDCFLYSTLVAIQTDFKILVIDVCGMVAEDGSFFSSSIDLGRAGFESYVTTNGMSSFITIGTVAAEKPDITVYILFKSGYARTVNLVSSASSRDASLQELHDRPFEGRVELESLQVKRGEIELATDRRNSTFVLTDKGFISRSFYRNREAAVATSQHIDLFGYLPKGAQPVGFLPIQGLIADDEEIYVMAKEKEEGDFIYLKNASTRENITTEPIPAHFGNKPVFAHFNGGKEYGRCCLYTINTRKFGDIPELIRVDARVAQAHNKEALRYGASLFQPNKKVQLVQLRVASPKVDSCGDKLPDGNAASAANLAALVEKLGIESAESSDTAEAEAIKRDWTEMLEELRSAAGDTDEKANKARAWYRIVIDKAVTSNNHAFVVGLTRVMKEFLQSFEENIADGVELPLLEAGSQINSQSTSPSDTTIAEREGNAQQPEQTKEEAHPKAVKTEKTTNGGSVSQANDVSGAPRTLKTYTVSSYGTQIEIHELSKKGKLALRINIDLRNDNDQPFYISSFDSCVLHERHELFIIATSFAGETMLIRWNSDTNDHQCRVLATVKDQAKVSLFNNELEVGDVRHFARVGGKSLKVFEIDGQNTKEVFELQLPVNEDEKVLVGCSGDGAGISNVWAVTREELHLFSGRNGKLDEEVRILDQAHYSFSGDVKSMSLLSTRKNDSPGKYAEFLFVVKDKCPIGLISVVREKGQLPDGTFGFANLRKTISKSSNIVVHSELIESNIDESGTLTADVRLYIAKKKSVQIIRLKIAINSDRSMGVKELMMQHAEIPITIASPCHIVVTRMEKTNNRAPPKYAIISGAEGAEVVRICEKKLCEKKEENGISC